MTEERKEYQRNWRKNCSEESKKKLRDKKMRYYYKHLEDNKEKELERGRIYRENNKEKIKMYYQLNKEVLKEKANVRRINRKKNDMLYKLSLNIASLIRQSIIKNGYTKKTRTYNIVGCSYIELRDYIENRFEPWMNWDNYGKYNGELNYGWDIDHIIPISSATSEDDIYKLNHYTNLQPLCSYVNRYIKRNKKDE